jgi:hypothetical protein
MKNIFYFLIFGFLISSCSKDDAVSGRAELSNCTYFKTREGTEFKYELTQNGVKSEKLLIAEKSTKVDGKEYIELSTTFAGQVFNQYLDCDGENFIVGAEVNQSLSGGVVKLFALEFKLDNALNQEFEMGTVITTDQSGLFELTNDYKGKVLARNAKKTVGGKSYPSVTEFELTTTSTIDGFEYSKLITIYYFIPEMGILFQETKNSDGDLISTETLIKYTY